ncbi:MAG: cytidylate kinase family protein [Methylococcales bacterium]|nr:cytidylate kinase family protein [Methylococcales bacterium]
MPIITITGDLASGKSLVAKRICSLLNADYFSTGQIQREIATKYGMTTLELNKFSETHPEIDQEIDNRVKMLANDERQRIVDSRMAWHFLPDSFKVFLSTNIVCAAERVIADTERSNEPVYADRNDAMLKLQERKRSENKRYLELYDADCSCLSNFDLVVDTTYSVPEDTIKVIISQFDEWQQGHVVERFWYSPRSILPLRPLVLAGQSRQGNEKPAIQVVVSGGNLYAYSSHEGLAVVLRNGQAYTPVKVIAYDDERLSDGVTVDQYLEGFTGSSVMKEWEQEFGFEYLAVSGRFSERQL